MNVVALLQLGALGLGALVFLLTFNLINTHLRHRRAATTAGETGSSDADRDLLRTIRIFLYVGIAAYLVAATVEVIGWITQPKRYFSYTVSPELTKLGYPDLEVRRADNDDVFKKRTAYLIERNIPLEIGADGIMEAAGNYKVQATQAVIEGTKLIETNAALLRSLRESRSSAGAPRALAPETATTALNQSSESLKNLRVIADSIRAPASEERR